MGGEAVLPPRHWLAKIAYGPLRSTIHADIAGHAGLELQGLNNEDYETKIERWTG